MASQAACNGLIYRNTMVRQRNGKRRVRSRERGRRGWRCNGKTAGGKEADDAPGAGASPAKLRAQGFRHPLRCAVLFALCRVFRTPFPDIQIPLNLPDQRDCCSYAASRADVSAGSGARFLSCVCGKSECSARGASAGQPGGHCSERPPSRCRCRCGTLWPAASPMFVTSR